MFTTILEVLGVLCLAALAFAIWPPAALGVVGVACLVAAWREEAAKAADARRKAGVA